LNSGIGARTMEAAGEFEKTSKQEWRTAAARHAKIRNGRTG
jgi:hypothetical protein